ncbi:MAG: ArdC family protein [Pseudomonadota bacterium]
MDLYQTITDRIIAALETAPKGPGRPFWRGATAASAIPFNLKTSARYRGVNTVNLWLTAQACGYSSPAWLTFKQARELGGHVRRGEKATLGVFYASAEVVDEQAEGEDKRSHAFPIVRPFWVFNLDQIDGIADAEEPSETFAPIAAAEAVIAGSKARIIEGGTRAFYSPQDDEICLPERSRFISAEAFYGVALHELTHWTGHPSRLNRDFSGRFGSEAYAFEELIAELGSAFLIADIGLVDATLDGHASYVSSWLRILKNDKRAVFTAASQAVKAHEFLARLLRKTEGRSD